MQPRDSLSFARAKIQPPSPRTVLVERPALEAALDEALLHHRLTVLLAPAGYGKTAALARQIHRLPAGCALAWISADEDDHLARFLDCLSTALEPHDLPWRVAPTALATLAQGEHGLRNVAAELVNALASAEVPRGLIVIDDAHRIADPQVFELLQAVLERLPPHWGFAVASRVEPPLALARWRARGELAEFRQHALRFDEAELQALVASSGAALAPEAVRELLLRTEGWAAGLRLGLSTRVAPGGRVPGAAVQRHLFDYLASEVLDEMPADLRTFLLRCAVLPELTADRCAHVAGVTNATVLLEEVERRGLFVATLDADELTLRLHDLFRDFLEDRLQRTLPQELPGLLRRAADVEPDLRRAVGYLARAGSWDEAAIMLAQRGPALIPIGGGPALEQMLSLFPPAAFDAHPELHLLRGMSCFPRFDFDAMVAAMLRAADGFGLEGRAHDAAMAQAYAAIAQMSAGGLAAADEALRRLQRLPSMTPELRALICFASAWSAYAQQRSSEVAPHFAAMLDALEGVQDPEVWDRCFFTSILTGVPGLAPLLDRFAAGALRRAGEAPSQLRCGALHVRAWLAFGAGRLDEAARRLALADEDVRWLGRPRSLMTENWMAHALIDAARGDARAALRAAEESEHDMAEHSLRSNRLTHGYEIVFTHLRAAWMLGDAPRVRRLEAVLQGTANPLEWPAAEDDRRMARAMVALLDRRFDDACLLLSTLAAQPERSCFYPAAQARLLWADALAQQGQAEAAAEILRPWLAAAHRHGEPGAALLAGAPVLQRLSALCTIAQQDRALLQSLLGQMDGASADAPPAAARPSPAAQAQPLLAAARAELAALSERERQVLARIAAGDSNKLIARTFDLSPHTVKRHVANILDKLGVSTRGQAAARWRATN